MEIVTGLRGTPHITSADVIGFQQGIATVGSGALPVGEKFRAELASNNELKIYDGEGVIQGVHFRVLPGTYDSITLENGSQGQKRKDLIVVKYTKNAQTGYENTEWVVKKGTSTTETPAEPTATEGDVRAGDILAEVPWYVVEYDGINVTSVTPKFSTLMNIQELTEGFSSLNSNLDNKQDTFTAGQYIEGFAGDGTLLMTWSKIGVTKKPSAVIITSCSSQDVIVSYNYDYNTSGTIQLKAYSAASGAAFSGALRFSMLVIQ